LIDFSLQDKVVVKGINDRSVLHNLSQRARAYLVNDKLNKEISVLEFRFNIEKSKFVSLYYINNL